MFETYISPQFFLTYQAIGSETTGLFVQLPQNDTIPQGVSRHKTLFQMAV